MYLKVNSRIRYIIMMVGENIPYINMFIFL